MTDRESVLDMKSLLFGSFLLVSLVALYWPFLQSLVADWGTNDDYSHGYFIPFLTIYFIYHIRDELKQLKIKPNIFGLLIIAAGLGQLLIAKIGSEFFLQRTSLVIVLYGLVLFFLGWDYFKKLFFPLSYLFFMIPLLMLSSD
jgi:exosortase